MNKKQIQKNILDLKYQLESQKINATLIFSSVGVLTFIGSFIWYSDRLIFGLGLSVIIVLVSFLYYRKVKKNMNKILEDLENL